MKFCNSHWKKLRQAVRDKGLWPFVANSSKELEERVKEELDGKVVIPDPLMTAHTMILGRALEAGGLYLMTTPPEGGNYCPLCELDKHTKTPPPGGGIPSDWWIKGSTDQLQKDYKKQGWLKDN